MKEIILEGSQIQSHIYIEKNLVVQAGEMCLGNLTLDCVCIITDSNVAPLYLEMVKKSFGNGCQRLISYTMEAGEKFKNLKTVEEIYKLLAENAFGREDMMVALGGGVVGDLAGFVAATYLRGIKHLVQIPTTLLAQVDSSVGGKCGVDLPQGKNLVGAFRQPNQVIVDVTLLKTLNQKIFASGLAEVIKYGCIFSEEIIEITESYDLFHETEKIEELVSACITMKKNVVETDEFEKGERKLLNFGHTLGHAVEKLGAYSVFSHGEAVSIGMVAALKMGENLEITKKGSALRVEALLRKYQLPVFSTYSAEAIFTAMLSDKKRQGNSLSFIFSEKLGEGKIVDMAIDNLAQQVKKLEEK